MNETLLEFVFTMVGISRVNTEGTIAMAQGRVGRIIFSRLREDDDAAQSMKKCAQENSVKAGVFLLIGALKSAVLGCYKEGEYLINRFNGHLEVASCTGNIAVDERGETIIHAHMVVSNDKGEAFGGHLMNGSLVGPTAELVIIEAVNVVLERCIDRNTNLKLLRLD